MKKRLPKKLRERNKIRCKFCKKELLDALEKIDEVCYFCNKNPVRRKRYMILNAENEKAKREKQEQWQKTQSKNQ